jgi:hypothetical protein
LAVNRAHPFTTSDANTFATSILKTSKFKFQSSNFKVHIQMITNDFKVLGCGNLIQVPSQKAEGGMILKKYIRLQEFGGSNRNDTPDRSSNSIVATLMGNAAQCNYSAGTLVKAALRFSIREYQGTWYQDIVVSEIQDLQHSVDPF